MTAELPLLEIASLVEDAGARDLRGCMQCGVCTGVCPWQIVDVLSPRRVMRDISFGLEGWEQEAVWRCVTCNACEQVCPRQLCITGIMQSARAVLQESGTAPRSLSGPLASLRTDGNPWNGDRSSRSEWAASVGMPFWNADCDTLLFPCCAQIYDARNRRAARALATLLSLAGCSAGTLQSDSACCGEQAKRVGAVDVFNELLRSNEQVFREADVSQVLVASPHCLDVFRAEPVSRKVRVEHVSQALWRYVEAGNLRPVRPVRAVITYHDPCYLGRYAGVYDAPRHVINAIPGIDFREMERCREDSLCCGGGGGGMFLETAPDKRLSVHRVREARESGASILVVSCPYCMLMFEDAITAAGLSDELAVMDLSELLLYSIADSDGCEAVQLAEAAL